MVVHCVWHTITNDVSMGLVMNVIVLHPKLLHQTDESLR